MKSKGVNQAMQDANELARAIIDFVNGGANTLGGVLKQYEEEMFERVEVFGKESAANLNCSLVKIHQRAWLTSLWFIWEQEKSIKY